MGFFSEIASEARRNGNPAVPPPAAPEVPAQQAVLPQRPSSGPDPAAPEPESGHNTGAVTLDPKQTEAEPPAIDLTPGADADDDAERRKAHEAAEAKRKAVFDAKQAEKRTARQKQLDRIKAMNDAELLSAAVDRVATDTERLTRRNMKEAVSEHIQVKCRENAAFSMLVMDPEKSMVNCFQYINRKAQEYAEREMKDQGIKRSGVYGLDVPDGLCYKWAEDYFNDPDAKEDHEDGEKFVPKPYVSAGRKASQGTAAKKPEKKKPAAEKPAEAPGHVMEQISLM